MSITNQALQLFVKSLPSNDETFFQIISFGSSFKFLNKEKVPLAYNQDNLDLATNAIDKFSANMIGTNIRKPL